jgi:hypothetical protein
MWDETKCDRCGDCFVECLYVDWDRAKAIAEISSLIETGRSEILSACVTCCACNEYCEKGANPWDLILRRQEETGCLTILPRAPALFEMASAMPSSVVPGDPDKPALSVCIMEPLAADILEAKLFQGLTLLKGGDYFCKIGYLHLGQERPVREGAARVVEKLAAAGKEEIVCFHEDCYALLTAVAPAYGVEVPFRPVHLFEYLLDYLQKHSNDIRKLDLAVAYQKPCASRYSTGKDRILDEIFALIGVTRVERTYDRRHALCCGGPLIARGLKEESLRLGRTNVKDAQAHGAQYLAFLCPMCRQTLRLVCEQEKMPMIAVSDLCRMALGEPLERPTPA